MQDLQGMSVGDKTLERPSSISGESVLDGTNIHEDFDTEGISAEELKYWAQTAPEDQKLAYVEDSPFEKTIHAANPRRKKHRSGSKYGWLANGHYLQS